MQQAGGLAAPKGSFLGQIAIAGYFGLSNVNRTDDWDLSKETGKGKSKSEEETES